VEGSGRGLIKGTIRHFPRVTEETTKNLSQGSRSSGRDLNPGLPEYEAVMLSTEPPTFGFWLFRMCVMRPLI
jgi:hypothetical protein